MTCLPSGELFMTPFCISAQLQSCKVFRRILTREKAQVTCDCVGRWRGRLFLQRGNKTLDRKSHSKQCNRKEQKGSKCNHVWWGHSQCTTHTIHLRWQRKVSRHLSWWDQEHPEAKRCQTSNPLGKGARLTGRGVGGGGTAGMKCPGDTRVERGRDVM